MKKDIKNNKIIYETSVGLYYRHEVWSIEQIKALKSYLKHSHPQYEIYWLKSGNVTYHINGNKYHINAGDLLILNAYEYHMVETLPTDIYDRCNIHIPISLIPILNGLNILSDFFLDNPYITIIPAKIIEKSAVSKYFMKMEKICLEDGVYQDYALLAETINLSIELNKIIRQMKKQETTVIYNSSKIHPAINNCIQYINNNIYKHITIDEISENLNMSKSRLQHLFKQYTETSLSDYILKQKMQTAYYLLRTGNTPIEVSNNLGYDYYSTFCMNFKKFFGSSPQKIINNETKIKK